MPNAKISALTSATTPLAGTETLPIVQSSTTKQVSVANLTAGRNVSMSGGTVTSGGSIRSYRPDNAIYTDQYMAAGASGGYTFNNANGDGFKWQYAGIDQFTIDTSSNFVPKTAGKGINFTANTPAAAMTSQLLNWYEEGTWTPTITSLSGIILTVGTVVGRYTRIGRSVSVNLSVAITLNGTGASAIVATTLPIAASTSLAVYSGYGYNGSTGKSLSVATQSSDNKVYIRYYDATYPIGSGETIYVSLTYTV